MSETHVLYRMFDAQGQLLYVGVTARPATRFRSHSVEKDWWANVANIALESFHSREGLLDAERVAIINEQPLHNVVHNNKVRRDKSVDGLHTVAYTLNDVVDAGWAPSVLWLQRLIRRGAIPGRKVGREWRMTESDVDALLDYLSNRSRRTKPPILASVEPIVPPERTGLSARSAARRSM